MPILNKDFESYFWCTCYPAYVDCFLHLSFSLCPTFALSITISMFIFCCFSPFFSTSSLALSLSLYSVCGFFLYTFLYSLSHTHTHTQTHTNTHTHTLHHLHTSYVTLSFIIRNTLISYQPLSPLSNRKIVANERVSPIPPSQNERLSLQPRLPCTELLMRQIRRLGLSWTSFHILTSNCHATDKDVNVSIPFSANIWHVFCNSVQRPKEFGQ